MALKFWEDLFNWDNYESIKEKESQPFFNNFNEWEIWIWMTLLILITTPIYFFTLLFIFKKVILYILYWKNIPKNLEDKLWYRLLKVIFILSILIVFISSIIIFYDLY